VSHRQDDFEAGLPGLYSASVIPVQWQVPAGVLIHVYDPGQSKQLGALSGADLLQSQLPCADRSRRRLSLGQYLAAKAAKAAKETATAAKETDESPSHGQSASAGRVREYLHFSMNSVNFIDEDADAQGLKS
jgi:hypothetical protein